MVKITVDPVTRTSGGLRVMIDLNNGSVIDAKCSGTSYRGIEQMLIGRQPMDSVYFTQRVCGMCSASHATASANAIESLCESTAVIPKDALIIRNILNGLAWLRSHIEHLYLIFLPDIADPMYRDMLKTSEVGNRVWNEFNGRFASPDYALSGVESGKGYIEALKCIKLISQAEAILGGRSPHMPAIVPGGVTCRPTGSDIYSLKECYEGIMDFLQRRLLGPTITVDEWLKNTHEPSSNMDFLWNNISDLTMGEFTPENGWGDMQLFMVFCSRMVSRDFLSGPVSMDLDTIGGYPLYDQLIGFLSYGSFYKVKDNSGNYKDGYVPLDAELSDSYEIPAGFTPGSMQNIYSTSEKLDPNLIVEHVYSSFYTYGEQKSSKSPLNGETSPLTGSRDIDYGSVKYSFIKAPRYGNVPCEVGPLARLINSREKLIIDIMKMLHDKNMRGTRDRSYPMTSTYTRVLSRMQETLIVAKMLGDWIENDLGVHSGERKYYVPLEIRPKKTGSGLIEAPRGALGHWLKLDGYGNIANYQIISPTSWNASPMDKDMKYGPMELSLLGVKTTPLGNKPGSESNPTSIYHVVRSFDPCVSCAVHTIRKS
ncbi:NiFe hydrogenase [Methanocella sp. CWC-04]|uniref:NiFe hydrogenase n=1 Tax=Methanooceanicella nereidis TaxID=2052831 RepID=A0AAP2REK1_9EURY|nr:nickel-dependent hydrogenase large subunit [Methanocella sp. CWC-04]MCD1296269.1 NiFe hydrogenase [Methanocella sp. CWC-04]